MSLRLAWFLGVAIALVSLVLALLAVLERSWSQALGPSLTLVAMVFYLLAIRRMRIDRQATGTASKGKP